MDEPTWLDRRVVDAIHQALVQMHGGSFGVRDDGLIESALARPRNRWEYDPGTDLAALAAAYAYGLARNHGFVDGNKRVSFMAAYTFLGLNGVEIDAPEPEVVVVMTHVAAGESSEEELAAWIRQRAIPFEG